VKWVITDKMQWDHYILYLLSPSSTHGHIVGQITFGMWSKIEVPSTAMSSRSNRLLDSEHGLQVLQQLWTTLMSLTTGSPTTWRHLMYIVSNLTNVVTLKAFYIQSKGKQCRQWSCRNDVLWQTVPDKNSSDR